VALRILTTEPGINVRTFERLNLTVKRGLRIVAESRTGTLILHSPIEEKDIAPAWAEPFVTKDTLAVSLTPVV
jgi:hypothetical protein